MTALKDHAQLRADVRAFGDERGESRVAVEEPAATEVSATGGDRITTANATISVATRSTPWQAVNPESSDQGVILRGVRGTIAPVLAVRLHDRRHQQHSHELQAPLGPATVIVNPITNTGVRRA